MSILIRIGDREPVEGFKSVSAIHYNSSKLNRRQVRSFDIRVPYIPNEGSTVLIEKETNEPFMFQRDVERDDEGNVTDETYTEVGSFALFDIFEKIEKERVKHTELMPWTVPDSDEKVEVKVQEEPPDKPRQTWLSGTCSWGIANVQKGSPDEVDDLIAADDTSHSMTAEQWVDFGISLKKWVKDNFIAAKEHMKKVKELSTVEEVKNYDYTTDWPE